MGIQIQVTFDAGDPRSLSEFWAAALGYMLQTPPGEHDSWESWLQAMGIPEESWNDASAIVDPDGAGPRVFFQRVPEGKTAKNRVHLDINAGGGHDVEYPDRIDAVDNHVDMLIDLGGTKIEAISRRGEYWVVMQDPEGNEFCVQ